jgi:hypothetical protein
MKSVKKDYLRDFSGFISEAYSSRLLDPQRQKLVAALKKLHVAERDLQLIELDYVQSGGSERHKFNELLNDQIDLVKDLEWRVGEAYRQSGIDDIVER